MHKILFCAIALAATSVTAAVPSSQRDALIALYQATGGDAWYVRDGWLGAPGTECNWQGVDCDGAETTVVDIYLYDNNLTGSLPQAIGSFPGLQSLQLWGNALEGPLPGSIGNLSNLETLILDRNRFSGPIPAAVGQLAKLTVFHVDGNGFTSIPRETGNLSALEDLDFSYNELTGPIPSEIGQLRNLVSLQLAVNRLDGGIPSSFANLTNLELLGLSDNELSGPIPDAIASMSKLVSLSLNINSFEGPIPLFLRSLRDLEDLELGSNELTGGFPRELAELTKLRYLDLSSNNLEGGLPSELFGVTTLEELVLYDNNFSGPLSPQIANLTALTNLWLGLNAFSGPIPRELGSLTKLYSLELLENDFTGTIPVELGQLKELVWLDLAGNRLTGTIPPVLGSLPQLGFLSLYENELEGTIPPELGNLSNLHTLYLTSNRLTGTIPDSLRNLRSLQSFWLGGNRLGGEIPSWIGDLPLLNTIYFPENQFTGTIPASIGQLTNLESLYLGRNRLTGSIPHEIGNLTNLSYLSLEDNEIGGAIPIEFWNLTDLVEIRLDRMALSGELPPDVGNLRRAEVFLLNHNQLEGTIPPEIGNLENVLYLSLGANRLTGPIPREIARLENVLQLDLYDNALRGPIPPEITGMTSLEDGQSDFGFNALTASGSTLDFVNRKQYDGDVLYTQTLPPANVRVIAVSDRSATLEWDLIRYVWDGGGYQVTATAGNGSTVIATTPSKENSSIVVRGLDASTTYQFVVSTVTHPHDQQKNIIVSDPTSPVGAATTTRVIAPADVVLTESTTGLIQIDGVATNQDGFTLTNFGDTATTVTFNREGDFFTIEPQGFSIGAGESRRVTVRSLAQPPGSYYGYVDPNGDGVGDDIYVPVTLLSTVRPPGTVIAEALTTRVEVAGAPGSDSIGQARFRNRGTSPLSGIVLSDQPWVVPRPDPITIYPDEIGTVTFTVVRSRRPPEALGALTANLSLVYVAGATDNARIIQGGGSGTDPNVSVSLVTIVDTPKPPVSPATLPPVGGAEVAWFAPGIASFTSAVGRFVSDVSVLNSGGARNINDLRLYFTPAGGSSSVASLSAITPSQSLSLANVVTNVYGVESGFGSLQFRSNSWISLAPAVRLVAVTADGARTGEMPVFRSDRSSGTSQPIYLTGLRKTATTHTDIFLQETAGAPAAVRIEFLDTAGSSAAAQREVNLAPFEMLQLSDAATTTAVSAIVDNHGSGGGRIAAYARVIDDASGDTWSLPDWTRLSRFTNVEPVRIPFVHGTTAPVTGRGRRRVAPHGAAPRSRTEVTLFNPAETELRARLQLVESGGRNITREITVAPRQTTVITDAGSGAATSTASLVITPLGGGQMIATARSSSGSGGTAVPVVPAASGLRVGQSQRFPSLSDSTAATITAARAGTFRTSYGFVETAGRPATVRARLFLDGGRDLATAILYRDYPLGPNQQIVADQLVRSIVGDSRDSLGELNGLQLMIEVVNGGGAVLPFVIVTENATGDTLLRTE